MLQQAEINAAEQKGRENETLKVVETGNTVYCIVHGDWLTPGTSYLGEADTAFCFCCCITRFQLDDGSTSSTIAALHRVLQPLFE